MEFILNQGWQHHVLSCVLEFIGGQIFHAKPTGSTPTTEVRRIFFAGTSLFANVDGASGNTDAIYFEGANGKLINDIHITNCAIGNFDLQKNAIHLKSVQNFEIFGNRIGGASQVASNTYDAIYIDDDGVSPSQGGTISGNTFDDGDNSSGTSKERYGISLWNLSKKITIGSNQFDSMQVPIYIQPTCSQISISVQKDQNGNSILTGKQTVNNLSVGGVGAVDLDGSTEYASKTTPSATTQMDDTLLINNYGAEVNTNQWQTTGGSFTRVTTAPVLAGVASFRDSATSSSTVMRSDSLLALNTTYMIKFLVRYTKHIGGEFDIAQRRVSLGGLKGQITVIASPVQDSTYNISLLYTTTGDVGYNCLCFGNIAANECFRIDNIYIRKLFNLSLFAWVKVPVSSTEVAIVNRKADDTAPSSGYSLSIDSTQSKPTMTLSDGTTQYKVPWVGTDINDGQWHFVAGQIYPASTSTLGISVDGGAFTTATITTVPDSLTSDLVLGKYGTNYGAQVLGELQIVRGLNPTVSQLQSIVTNGIPSSWSGATVAAHYKWGASTAFLTDQTGNNNLTGTNVDVAGDRMLGTYSSFSTRGGGIDSLGNGKLNSLTVGSNGALIDSAKVDTGLAFSVGGVKYHALTNIRRFKGL